MNKDCEGTHQAPQQSDKPSRLIPVTHWNRYHDWPPVGGLRHLAFLAKDNGFEKAFVRVGRRLLIDEDEFFRIIREQNEMKK
jgi:hypothetical protein